MIKDLTIITPSLIGERYEYLKELLESVNNQIEKPEYHIIRGMYNNELPYMAFNKALDMVETEWMMIMSDDDIFFPEHIKVCAKYMQDYDIIGSGFEMFGDRDKIKWLESKWTAQSHPNGHIIINPLMRTEIWRKIGQFDKNLDSDKTFYWNAWRCGYKFAWTNQITWKYRVHNNQCTFTWEERCKR
jgi:hypothetical protein